MSARDHADDPPRPVLRCPWASVRASLSSWLDQDDEVVQAPGCRWLRGAAHPIVLAVRKPTP